MSNYALLDPANYVNWFLTEFPDMRDDAGRSIPVTGASPVVVTYGSGGDQLSAALAGAGPNASTGTQQTIRSKPHAQLLALSLVVGIILTILLLGLIAFRVQVTVK